MYKIRRIKNKWSIKIGADLHLPSNSDEITSIVIRKIGFNGFLSWGYLVNGSLDLNLRFDLFQVKPISTVSSWTVAFPRAPRAALSPCFALRVPVRCFHLDALVILSQRMPFSLFDFNIDWFRSRFYP